MPDTPDIIDQLGLNDEQARAFVADPFGLSSTVDHVRFTICDAIRAAADARRPLAAGDRVTYRVTYRDGLALQPVEGQVLAVFDRWVWVKWDHQTMPRTDQLTDLRRLA